MIINENTNEQLNVNVIDNEITHVQNMLDDAKLLKQQILLYSDKVVSSLNTKKSNNSSSTINDTLKDLKNSIETINTSTKSFTELIDILESSKSKEELNIYIYNKKYGEAICEYMNTSKNIHSFTANIIPFVNIDFENSVNNCNNKEATPKKNKTKNKK